MGNRQGRGGVVGGGGGRGRTYPSLVKVLLELMPIDPRFNTRNPLHIVHIPTLLRRTRRYHVKSIRPIIDLPLMNPVLHRPVPVKVHDRTNGPINRQLLEISPQPTQLRIKVREVSPLQEGVIAKPNPRDNMRGAKCRLLRLSEELIDVPVEDNLPDVLNWDEVLRPQLGSVENIKVEFMLTALGENLNAELPLGEVALLDGLVEILAVEVGVLPGKLEGFIPDEGVYA